MRPFHRKRVPEVRKWILAASDKLLHDAEVEPSAIGKAIATIIVLPVTGFFLAYERRDGGKRDRFIEEILEKYNTDACCFEIFCYVLFKTDFWLFQTYSEAFRDMFAADSIPFAASTWSKFVKSPGIQECVANRLQVYATLLSKHRDDGKAEQQAKWYLWQFFYRAKRDSEVIAHNVEDKFPVYTADFHEAMELDAMLEAFMNRIFPMIRNGVSNIARRWSKG